MEAYLHRGRPYRVQHGSTTLHAQIVALVDPFTDLNYMLGSFS